MSDTIEAPTKPKRAPKIDTAAAVQAAEHAVMTARQVLNDAREVLGQKRAASAAAIIQWSKNNPAPSINQIVKELGQRRKERIEEARELGLYEPRRGVLTEDLMRRGAGKRRRLPSQR